MKEHKINLMHTKSITAASITAAIGFLNLVCY